jgi:hypothetical protein
LLGSNPSSTSHSPQQLDELDDFIDDDHPENSGAGPSPLVAALDDPKRQSLFYAGNAEQKHFFAEAETMPRRMRMRNRPSTDQTDELRKLYRLNPHPSKDDREALGEQIGMCVSFGNMWEHRSIDMPIVGHLKASRTGFKISAAKPKSAKKKKRPMQLLPKITKHLY